MLSLAFLYGFAYGSGKVYKHPFKSGISGGLNGLLSQLVVMAIDQALVPSRFRGFLSMALIGGCFFETFRTYLADDDSKQARPKDGLYFVKVNITYEQPTKESKESKSV
jgi:hypothetical protein